MAAHSSVNAWRIPGMGEPGGLPSMGSHRVGYNLSDLAVAVAHLKQLEKEEIKNPRASRRKEIIKIRAEINTKKKTDHSKNQQS